MTGVMVAVTMSPRIENEIAREAEVFDMMTTVIKWQFRMHGGEIRYSINDRM